MMTKRIQLLSLWVCCATVVMLIYSGPSTLLRLEDVHSVNHHVSIPDGRPPLSSLIGDRETNITGNVAFLLDFVIAGHPKCGTTFLNKWLAEHPEILMYNRELHSIKNGKPALLVEELYNLPRGKEYKRGYKAPNDLRRIHSLHILNKFWPNANLIVGLRHPVLWFQSWYNYHDKQDPAEEFIGKKLPLQVRYHKNLCQLGKTNTSDPAEAALLNVGEFPRTKPRDVAWRNALFHKTGIIDPTTHMAPMPQKVFLYVDLQLMGGDSNNTTSRQQQFRKDLQAFLGLQQELSPLPTRPENMHQQSNTATTHLDICQDRYKQLRSELVEMGAAASEWIRTYFLPHPDVFVSSPEYFQELLSYWKEDPCIHD